TFFTVLPALPMVLGVYSIATLVLARNEEQVQKLTADFIGTYLPQEWADAAQRVVDAVVGSTQLSTLMLVLSVVLALFRPRRMCGRLRAVPMRCMGEWKAAGSCARGQ